MIISKHEILNNLFCDALEFTTEIKWNIRNIDSNKFVPKFMNMGHILNFCILRNTEIPLT